MTEKRVFCCSLWLKYYVHLEEGSYHPSQGLQFNSVKNVCKSPRFHQPGSSPTLSFWVSMEALSGRHS